MATTAFTFPLPGTLGNVAGGGLDGVLLGALALDDPSKVLLKSLVSPSGLCITDDGGLYVQKSTEFNEATADDVQPFPATPVADDAVYFGLAAQTFAEIQLNITTQGDLVCTVDWEYWNGSAWTALSGVTDGTSNFSAATGTVSVTFTLPGDWEENTVDSVEAFWIRANVATFTSQTIAPLLGQGWVVGTAVSWVDDTTDATDAGAGDVELLPTFPLVGDGVYIGHAEKFCKVKATYSQARTGTATISLKYWNGSAWVAVTTLDDDSVGWSATAGTHLIHFVPPDDWAANTAANGPNGEAGYFVVMELTALTDVTQQPLGTQLWVLPIKTGGEGFIIPVTSTIRTVKASAGTVSGATADSSFLVINTTKGLFQEVVWPKGDSFHSETVSMIASVNDQIAIVQVTEDGTTEFADASMQLILS